jgi:hypothetical protein
LGEPDLRRPYDNNIINNNPLINRRGDDIFRFGTGFSMPTLPPQEVRREEYIPRYEVPREEYIPRYEVPRFERYQTYVPPPREEIYVPPPIQYVQPRVEKYIPLPQPTLSWADRDVRAMAMTEIVLEGVADRQVRNYLNTQNWLLQRDLDNDL